ncbi:IS630 family transposase [Spirosoma daeguense]
MSRIANPFVLTDSDLIRLTQLVSKGKESARKLTRARALQFLHQGHRPQQISDSLGISVATVFNLKKRYHQGGLQPAITEKGRPGQPRKVTQQVEAQITQLACSQAPDGRTRWTANLINEKLVKLDIHIDDESVRLVLKKVSLNPGLKSNAGRPERCIGQVDGEYLAKMEDVRFVYNREACTSRARICFNERPCQLLDNVVEPLLMKPGRATRGDNEYIRQGTAVVLLAYDLDTGRRQT